MPVYRATANTEAIAVDDADALHQVNARFRQGLYQLVDVYEVADGWKNSRTVWDTDPTTGIEYHGSADS